MTANGDELAVVGAIHGLSLDIARRLDAMVFTLDSFASVLESATISLEAINLNMATLTSRLSDIQRAIDDAALQMGSK